MSNGRLKESFVTSSDGLFYSLDAVGAPVPTVMEVDLEPPLFPLAYEAPSELAWQETEASLRALAGLAPAPDTTAPQPVQDGAATKIDEPICPGDRESRPVVDVWLQRVPNPPRVDAETMDQGFREAQTQWRRERRWRRINNALIVAGCLCMAFFGWKAIQARANRVQSAAPAAAESAAAPQWQMKRVNEFKRGEKILAFNHQTGRTEYRRILQTFERTSDHLRLLDVQSSDGRTQRMETTDEHPFWLPERDEYILANQLKPGDEFLSPSGGLLSVVATEREEHPEGVPVYNVEVEGEHNYFVAAGPGAEPMLAHNKSGTELPEWKSRRSFTDDDSGLRNHSRKHSDLSPRDYLARGQKNVAHGQVVKGGKYPDATYHIRKVGDNAHSMTISDRQGRILSIDTWKPENGDLTKELLLKSFKNYGITAPRHFWDSF